MHSGKRHAELLAAGSAALLPLKDLKMDDMGHCQLDPNPSPRSLCFEARPRKCCGQKRGKGNASAEKARKVGEHAASVCGKTYRAAEHGTGRAPVSRTW